MIRDGGLGCTRSTGAIAAAAPLMTNLPWGGTPALVQEYLVPGPGRGRFPFFPRASYVGFGLAAGAIVKRAAADRLDRLMQWSAAQMMHLIQRAVERAFRLPCRYSCRHSPKNVGRGADVAT